MYQRYCSSTYEGLPLLIKQAMRIESSAVVKIKISDMCTWHVTRDTTQLSYYLQTYIYVFETNHFKMFPILI